MSNIDQSLFGASATPAPATAAPIDNHLFGPAATPAPDATQQRVPATMGPTTPEGKIADYLRLHFKRDVAPTWAAFAKPLATGAQWATNLFQTPQRFESGAIGSEEVGAKPGEHRTLPVPGIVGAHTVLPTGGTTLLDPATRKAFGAGVYGMLHPGQQHQLDVQGEKAIGLSAAFDKLNAVPDYAYMTLNVGPQGTVPVFDYPDQSGALKKPTSIPGYIPITMSVADWKQLGKDTIYENITDPVNLLFGANFARGQATKYAGTVLGRFYDAVATAGEAVPRAGAAAYRGIAPTTERALNFAGGKVARVVAGMKYGVKLPDIKATEQALSQARLANNMPEVKRLSNLLEQQNLAVSYGRKAKAYNMIQQGEHQGTQLLNLVRSNPFVRRGLQTQPVRHLETADQMATSYMRGLNDYVENVFEENEQAINDAWEQTKATKRDRYAQAYVQSLAGGADAARAANAAQAAADAVESVVPDEVKELNKRLAYLRGTDEVKAQVVADGYKPTDFERNLPTVGTLTHYKPEYVPHHTLTEAEPELLPGEERASAYKVQPSVQGVHSQLIPEPDVPLLARLRNKAAMDMRELGVGNNMLAKSLHLKGTRDKLLPGIAALPPDMEATQQALAAARRVEDDAEAARLQAQLDKQRADWDQARARLGEQINPGEQVIPLGDILEATGRRGAYLTDEQIKSGMFDQVAREMGLKPEQVAEMEGLDFKRAPQGKPISYTTRPKGTTTQEAFLRGRQSLRRARAAIVDQVSKVVQRVSQNVERMVQTELDRAARQAEAAVQATQGRVERMASAYETPLAKAQGLAEAKRIIPKTLEAPTSVKGRMVETVKGEMAAARPAKVEKAVAPAQRAAEAARARAADVSTPVESKVGKRAAGVEEPVKSPDQINQDLMRLYDLERNTGRTAAEQAEYERLRNEYPGPGAKPKGEAPPTTAQADAVRYSVRAKTLVPKLRRQADRLRAMSASVVGQDRRVLEHDARLLDTIIGREQFNHDLAMVRAEVERRAKLFMDQLVPKSYVQQYMGEKVAQPAITGFTLPTQLAKTLMFMNPFVHGPKNVLTLRMLTQGTTFNGMMHTFAMFAGEDPQKLDALMGRLGNAGGLASYGDILGEGAGKFARTGKALRGVTEKMDNTIRAGLLEDLDHSNEIDPFTGKPYKDMTDYEKVAVINESVGEYHHESELSRLLTRYGLPFPHWRFTMIARITKAMLTQPQRINAFLRTTGDFNRDIFAHDPYELGLYTPIDTGLEGLDPAEWGSFITGLGGPVQWLNTRGTFIQKLERAAASVPGVGPIEQGLGLDPFANAATRKMPGWQQAGLAPFAIYAKRKPKGEPIVPRERPPEPSAPSAPVDQQLFGAP